jgi:hypothetical protein
MHKGCTRLWRKIWSNAVLADLGKRFSRLKAWLFITNDLAAGKDNQAAGLKRGEFVASVRFLAKSFNWSRGSVLRFLEALSQNSMIMRVGHLAGQEAGHFSVCKYETYNFPRDTWRDTSRDTIKEVFKESKNKIKDTHMPSADGDRVRPQVLIEIFQQHNQSLPEVKALTAERLRKCQTRINQAVRDGCLDQYLADFTAAVKKLSKRPSFAGKARAVGGRASIGLLTIR